MVLTTVGISQIWKLKTQLWSIMTTVRENLEQLWILVNRIMKIFVQLWSIITIILVINDHNSDDLNPHQS